MAHILVVDDDRITIEIISVALQKENHVIAKAENGLEALKLIKQSSFDLVITDMVMPEMNGLDLLKEIRKSDIPVIVMTAENHRYVNTKQIVQYVEQLPNVHDVLIKPFSHLELIESVNRCKSISKCSFVHNKESEKF